MMLKGTVSEYFSIPLKGLRHRDLADFWPKTILEISGSQLNPFKTFSLNI